MCVCRFLLDRSASKFRIAAKTPGNSIFLSLSPSPFASTHI